ncbi:hypothetical protein ACP4OV_012039 [Aristida adscensionis]
MLLILWWTVRRALSMEGTLSTGLPLPHRRLVYHVDYSHRAPAQVDPLVKKVKNVARKSVLLESTERLLQDHNEKFVTVPSAIAIFAVFLFMSGYEAGFQEATAKIRKPKESKLV